MENILGFNHLSTNERTLAMKRRGTELPKGRGFESRQFENALNFFIYEKIFDKQIW